MYVFEDTAARVKEIEKTTNHDVKAVEYFIKEELDKIGDFEKYKYNSAVAYAWYIWEKGYNGDTILKWFN